MGTPGKKIREIEIIPDKNPVQVPHVEPSTPVKEPEKVPA